MKATFTEEQQQLAELAQRLAERIGADARGGGDPDAGWPLLIESGLVGLRLPAVAEGGAASAVEVAIVAEALGRHAAPAPFVGPVLAGDLLAAAGAPTDVLEELGTGQRRLTIALDPSLSGPGFLTAGGMATATRSGGTPAGPSHWWDWRENPTGRSGSPSPPGPALRWPRAISPASW